MRIRFKARNPLCVPVRDRSTREARARLLERPDVVAAIGRQTVADLKPALADARS
jgi:hypothetical protein